jgi:uncharacterized protein with HEPN domain
MPPRDPTVRIYDIVEAIERIEKYTEGMTFEHFRHNSLVVDAVVRNLEVIGEAAARIPDGYLPDTIPINSMRGMRNLLIHEYFNISLQIVWETLQNDLPQLRRNLESFLKD